MISALDPGGHIPPHSAAWNAILNLHLGLVIPNDCGIKVRGENKTWEEGKCILFDECFEHEAWNYGDTTRFILFANVWHPELSPAEIAFLDIFMSLVDLGEQSPHAQKRQQSEHELDGNIWWSS